MRTETPSEHELMDVLWNDTQINPTKHLTRLSQFVEAYVTTTIDKATEVSILIKEKDDQIALFL